LFTTRRRAVRLVRFVRWMSFLLRACWRATVTHGGGFAGNLAGISGLDGSRRRGVENSFVFSKAESLLYGKRTWQAETLWPFRSICLTDSKRLRRCALIWGRSSYAGIENVGGSLRTRNGDSITSNRLGWCKIMRFYHHVGWTCREVNLLERACRILNRRQLMFDE
jgi:hypothetical protein